MRPGTPLDQLENEKRRMKKKIGKKAECGGRRRGWEEKERKKGSRRETEKNGVKEMGVGGKR